MPGAEKMRGLLPFTVYLAALFTYIAGNHYLMDIPGYQRRVAFYLMLWSGLAFSYLFLIARQEKLGKLEKNPIFIRLMMLSRERQFIILLCAAFLIRASMLVLHPTLSSDIFFAMERSRHMLDGDTPYRDFEVNKPPAYAYMLYLMGLTMGVGDVQFRLFFIAVDMLVLFMVFRLAGLLLQKRDAFRAAWAYALLPLAAVDIGYSGHYDPVPTFFVLAALFLFLTRKGRWLELSSLSLGTAFALKLFPVVLLPFFLIKLKGNKRRAEYFLLFSLPMTLSLLPVLFITPHEFLNYVFNEQATGCSWNSISAAIIFMVGEGYQKEVEHIVLGITGLVLLYLYYLFRKGWRPEYGWAALLVYLISWFSLWLAAALNALFLPAAAALMIALIIIGFFAGRIMPEYILPRLKGDIDPPLLNALLFSATLIILGFNRLHSWYFLWLMPLAFLHRDRRVFYAYILLMILFQPVGIDI